MLIDNKYYSSNQKLDSAMVLYAMGHGTTSNVKIFRKFQELINLYVNDTSIKRLLYNDLITYTSQNVLLSSVVASGRYAVAQPTL